MISCEEAVGLSNKIGTCWNVAIQTNMFYGHNSEIIQKKLNDNTVDELLNPTVIENLERFLPPYLIDDTGKLLEANLDLIKKIVINLKKRFAIKNKQKVTKKKNVEEDVCERDFVYYTLELVNPKKRNKEYTIDWGGTISDSFLLTNILNIILLNKLTHIVTYTSNYLSEGNRISLNIDKIKSIHISVHRGDTFLNIKDLKREYTGNHACQFFECDEITKYSNDDIIIDYDWRMFFKILNMVSVSDYDKTTHDWRMFFKILNMLSISDYVKPSNPLTTYRVWENIDIGPYILTYDSELNPSIMYSFSPFFKVEKINKYNPVLIAESCVIRFNFSYNIECTPENIKRLIGINVKNYFSLDMMNNFVMTRKLLDIIDVNIINDEKESIITKGVYSNKKIFVVEALKRINKTTLNHQDKNQQTALIIAVLLKDKYFIKEIMKYNADLTLTDDNGYNAMDYAKITKIDFNDLDTLELKNLKIAIQDNNLAQVKSLLDKLEYIDETDSNGYTILMYAIRNTNNLEVIKAILEKNPDQSIKDNTGKTARDYCIKDMKMEFLITLETPKSKPLKSVNVKTYAFNSVLGPFNSEEFNEIKIAIHQNDINKLKSLLDELKDINETETEDASFGGTTILIYAILLGKNLEIIKAVLDKNPDISIKNNNGRTALYYAKMLSKKDFINQIRCHKIDTLTVSELNEIFAEINAPIPDSKVTTEERLRILKNILAC
jgi:ankyrin repeat protein